MLEAKTRSASEGSVSGGRRRVPTVNTVGGDVSPRTRPRSLTLVNAVVGEVTVLRADRHAKQHRGDW